MTLRCNICDCTSEDKKLIKWVSRHKEYRCNTCDEIIKHINTPFEDEKEEEGEIPLLDDDF